MLNCLICHKTLEMITWTHLYKHNISFNEYARRFNLQKGQINPLHSKKMSGKGNPIYGTKRPKETRDKIRRTHKRSGRFKGKGNPMFGKTHTKEARRKISEKLKVSLLGEGNPFYGRKHKKKTKELISKIRIERGLAKGKNNPLFGKGHTEKTKIKISKIKKELFKKHPEKHVQYLIVKNYKKQKIKKGGYISKKQAEIYSLLKNKFKDAQLNFPIVTDKSVYFADVGIPSKKLDIEYDCWYWHSLKNDRKRDRHIKKVGWNVIRLQDRKVDKFDKVELLNYVLLLIQKI